MFVARHADGLMMCMRSEKMCLMYSNIHDREGNQYV